MKRLMIRVGDVLYTLLLLTALPHLAVAQDDGTPENKEAGAAFTCDFALPASFPASPRRNLCQQPGLLTHLWKRHRLVETASPIPEKPR